jgi:hypothetical protein
MIGPEDIDAFRLSRLLILCYARDGKDSVAEMLAK